ncbi:hypothetical protein ANN_23829 [Periplaneta americana]|uniref:Uncharacterized protein n=1 Tax=Periplaneta americana TaxID=6978 RepID=A0ABQ8SM45_PERAM|nr:hypothetical protein ANN_23829 [Periplaneta americana]
MIQPLDKIFFVPLKSGYSTEYDKFMVRNPGRVITHREVSSLFCRAYESVATPEKAKNSFRATDSISRPDGENNQNEQVCSPSTLLRLPSTNLQSKRKRMRKKSEIMTSSPYKNALETSGGNKPKELIRSPFEDLELKCVKVWSLEFVMYACKIFEEIDSVADKGCDRLKYVDHDVNIEMVLQEVQELGENSEYGTCSVNQVARRQHMIYCTESTRLFSVDEIGDSEMVFGEMRPRIRHRLPGIHLTVGENLGKNPTRAGGGAGRGRGGPGVPLVAAMAAENNNGADSISHADESHAQERLCPHRSQ